MKGHSHPAALDLLSRRISYPKHLSDCVNTPCFQCLAIALRRVAAAQPRCDHAGTQSVAKGRTQEAARNHVLVLLAVIRLPHVSCVLDIKYALRIAADDCESSE